MLRQSLPDLSCHLVTWLFRSRLWLPVQPLSHVIGTKTSCASATHGSPGGSEHSAQVHQCCGQGNTAQEHKQQEQHSIILAGLQGSSQQVLHHHSRYAASATQQQPLYGIHFQHLSHTSNQCCPAATEAATALQRHAAFCSSGWSAHSTVPWTLHLNRHAYQTSSWPQHQQPKQQWPQQQQQQQQQQWQQRQPQLLHLAQQLHQPHNVNQLLQLPVGGVRWAHSNPTARDSSRQRNQRPAPSPVPSPSSSNKPKLRRNSQITAARLMVVFPDGTRQVMDAREACAAAEGLGLDLVEVNPRGDPPVARIFDYSQMMYEQQQKTEATDKQRRLQQKLATPKEMQFSARIADHDLEVKMKKVTGWLDQGYRVQLVVKHRREEEEAAAEALTYLSTRLQSEFNVELGPQQAQRKAITVLVKPTAQQANK